MDEFAVGAIVKACRESLEEAADAIFQESKMLAEANKSSAEIRDRQADFEAMCRVKVSSEVNEKTGRPALPNIDAQNAAVLMMLAEHAEYQENKVYLGTLNYEIEMHKATLVRLHEKRRDTRTIADLESALLRSP